MKYPKIEKLGLNLWHNCSWQDLKSGKGFGDTMIKAHDLEALLESAQTVYGCASVKGCGETIWSSDQTEDDKKTDTHSAKLIMVEKLKKGVTKKEIIDTLMVDDNRTFDRYQLAKRIEAEGICE